MPSSTYGQKGVLLRAVEAVDLVDEQQRALPHLAALPGRLEHLAQIGDAGEHRRQRLEGEIGALCASSRAIVVLPQPGGPHRIIEASRPRRHHAADRPLGTEQMVLADDLGEALRPQPVGQRPRRLRFKQRAHVRQIWAAFTRMTIGSGLDSERRFRVSDLDP